MQLKLAICCKISYTIVDHLYDKYNFLTKNNEKNVRHNSQSNIKLSLELH